jgi:protein tyrosine phosphatase (PTP) superfamily phosphohydrolase (DUF442 family)
MRRRMLLLASVAVVSAAAGCQHCCWKKDGCCNNPPPPPIGARIVPPGVPTTPGPPSALPPATSGFLDAPMTPAPAPSGSGPQVLYPDPYPSGMSRPGASGTSAIIGAPVKPATVEPPKAATVGAGLTGFTKVKDGLYAGRQPAIDGYDSLKKAGFRTVIYLHGAGADVAAVKDLATTRDLHFIDIEATPETLTVASAQFDRAVSDRLTRPAYVFADEAPRAGAVWYLHFRTVDVADPDVARLKAKALGLSEQGQDGTAFAVAIGKVLEK